MRVSGRIECGIKLFNQNNYIFDQINERKIQFTRDDLVDNKQHLLVSCRSWYSLGIQVEEKTAWGESLLGYEAC